MKTTLTITAAARNGRTFLKDTYFTQPFRVANVSEDRRDPWLYLMLMSSSPGVLDQDQYDIRLCVEAAARVRIESQAYQRIFRMNSNASIRQEIHLEEESILSYVPHPVVPHSNSDITASTRITATAASALIFGEVLTCGRKLSGEQFLFSNYRNCITVNIDDKLIYKDNVVLQPKDFQLQSIGLFENYTHQAAFIYLDLKRGVSDALINELLIAATGEDVSVGITRINADMTAMRLLGNSGERLYDLLKLLEKMLRRTILQNDLPPALHSLHSTLS